jgi:hypothetical protein
MMARIATAGSSARSIFPSASRASSFASTDHHRVDDFPCDFTWAHQPFRQQQKASA